MLTLGGALALVAAVLVALGGSAGAQARHAASGRGHTSSGGGGAPSIRSVSWGTTGSKSTCTP